MKDMQHNWYISMLPFSLPELTTAMHYRRGIPPYSRPHATGPNRMGRSSFGAMVHPVTLPSHLPQNARILMHLIPAELNGGYQEDSVPALHKTTPPEQVRLDRRVKPHPVVSVLECWQQLNQPVHDHLTWMHHCCR